MSKSRLTAEITRHLTSEDLVKIPSRPVEKVPALQRFRDAHHRIARCFAAGMSTVRVGLQTGYSLQRLRTLEADPAFQDLVEVYRVAGSEELSEYSDLAVANMIRAEAIIADSLESVINKDVPLSLGELRPLMELTSDRADRFGFPKKTVQANVNLNLGDRLEAARKRSGIVDVSPQAPSALPESKEPVS